MRTGSNVGRIEALSCWQKTYWSMLQLQDVTRNSRLAQKVFEPGATLVRQRHPICFLHWKSPGNKRKLTVTMSQQKASCKKKRWWGWLRMTENDSKIVDFVQRIPNLWGHWIGHLCDEWSGAFAVENMCAQYPVAAFGFIERVTTWQVLSPKTFSRTVPVILGPPMSFTGSWCKWQHTRYTWQNVCIAALHSWIQAKIARNDRIITPNACRLIGEIASKMMQHVWVSSHHEETCNKSAIKLQWFREFWRPGVKLQNTSESVNVKLQRIHCDLYTVAEGNCQPEAVKGCQRSTNYNSVGKHWGLRYRIQNYCWLQARNHMKSYEIIWNHMKSRSLLNQILQRLCRRMRHLLSSRSRSKNCHDCQAKGRTGRTSGAAPVAPTWHKFRNDPDIIQWAIMSHHEPWAIMSHPPWQIWHLDHLVHISSFYSNVCLWLEAWYPIVRNFLLLIQ